MRSNNGRVSLTIENGKEQITLNISGLSFEDAYNRLVETAAKLEQGGLPLEESLVLFEEGVALSHYCEDLLAKAELKVSQLMPANTTGSFAAKSYTFSSEQEFDDESDDDESDDDESDDDEDWTDEDLRNALNELKF